MKRDLKRVVRKPTITTSGERQRGPLRLRRRPDAYCYCLPWSFLGVLVLKGKAWIGKGLESRVLGERLGAPEVLIYGVGEEIVAHIPRNLGSGETPSTEPSSGRLGFKLGHIRFD
jgi:hypothetical protein